MHLCQGLRIDLTYLHTANWQKLTLLSMHPYDIGHYTTYILTFKALGLLYKMCLFTHLKVCLSADTHINNINHI